MRDKMKGIIIYYSLSGNTKKIAEQIAKQFNWDSVEIQTVKGFPKNKAAVMFYGGAMASFGICPKIKPVSISLDSYEHIVIGTPVWAGKCAPAMRSFIKAHDLSHKKVDVFTCSGGGENEKCIAELKEMIPLLKNHVSLIDSNQADSKDNEQKLTSFMRMIHDKQ